MNNSTLIVDSSVIAKWFFPEKNSKKALDIKEKFASSEISIAVPVLLYYEVNNIMRTAVKAFRIDKKEAVDAYHAFLKLNFTTYSSQSLMLQTLKTAVKFDISSYDASYIALAEYLQITFVTADQKLLKKISSPLTVDLSDYVA